MFPSCNTVTTRIQRGKNTISTGDDRSFHTDVNIYTRLYSIYAAMTMTSIRTRPSRYPAVPSYGPADIVIRNVIRYPAVPSYGPAGVVIRYPAVPSYGPAGVVIRYPAVPFYGPAGVVIRYPAVLSIVQVFLFVRRVKQALLEVHCKFK